MDDAVKAEIDAYNSERNAMLLKGSPQALIDFQKAHGLPVASCIEVAEITLHKTRTGVATLPREARRASWLWLTQRGYGTWDDGDLATET